MKRILPLLIMILSIPLVSANDITVSVKVTTPQILLMGTIPIILIAGIIISIVKWFSQKITPKNMIELIVFLVISISLIGVVVSLI